MQNGRGDVDVVELVDPRRVETGTVGVGLGDLLAAYEANRVEVVDVQVGEDPARPGDVLGGWRHRVVRCSAHREDPPDRP